jgi:hypothetical protein
MSIEEEINKLEQQLRENSDDCLNDIFSEGVEELKAMSGNPELRAKAINVLTTIVYCASKYLHSNNSGRKESDVLAEIHMSLISAATALGMSMVNIQEWRQAIDELTTEMREA